MQRVYLNKNNNKNNIIIITIKVNQKLEKRFKNSTSIITYYEELKELIAKAKRLANVIATNSKYCKKIYKIYSDNQISLKTIKTIKLIIN